MFIWPACGAVNIVSSSVSDSFCLFVSRGSSRKPQHLNPPHSSIQVPIRRNKEEEEEYAMSAKNPHLMKSAAPANSLKQNPELTPSDDVTSKKSAVFTALRAFEIFLTWVIICVLTCVLGAVIWTIYIQLADTHDHAVRTAEQQVHEYYARTMETNRQRQLHIDACANFSALQMLDCSDPTLFILETLQPNDTIYREHYRKTWMHRYNPCDNSTAHQSKKGDHAHDYTHRERICSAWFKAHDLFWTLLPWTVCFAIAYGIYGAILKLLTHRQETYLTPYQQQQFALGKGNV